MQIGNIFATVDDGEGDGMYGQGNCLCASHRNLTAREKEKECDANLEGESR